MTKVYFSSVIPAPVDDVWSVAGDYARIYEWHPFVKSTQIKAGPAADQVGSIRFCTLENGVQLLETQTARSETERTYSYSIDDSPMPMKNYTGTVRVYPITENDTTFIEWHMTFDPNPGAETELPAMLREVTMAGFESLKAHFARADA